MPDIFQYSESYDIKGDKKLIRLSLTPRGTDKTFSVLLDDDMSIRKIALSLKETAAEMLESARGDAGA